MIKKSKDTKQEREKDINIIMDKILELLTEHQLVAIREYTDADPSWEPACREDADIYDYVMAFLGDVRELLTTPESEDIPEAQQKEWHEEYCPVDGDVPCNACLEAAN